MSEAIIQVDDVSKSYGGVKANVDISLQVKRGSITGIIGPNGCGKTTLMNMIGGLIDSESQVIKSTSRDTVEVEKFGYVFQTSRLLPWLTVKENIELVCL